MSATGGLSATAFTPSSGYEDKIQVPSLEHNMPPVSDGSPRHPGGADHPNGRGPLPPLLEATKHRQGYDVKASLQRLRPAR